MMDDSMLNSWDKENYRRDATNEEWYIPRVDTLIDRTSINITLNTQTNRHFIEQKSILCTYITSASLQIYTI